MLSPEDSRTDQFLHYIASMAGLSEVNHPSWPGPVYESYHGSVGVDACD